MTWIERKMNRTIGVPRLLRQAWLPACAALGSLLISPDAAAVETKMIRDDSFSQFLQGESTGTEILSTGFLRIAPLATRLDLTDQAVGWRVAVDRADGTVFYATGHDGKIFRHLPSGKSDLWGKLPEGQVISLAIDPSGGILAGASPGGKIYRIVEAGKPLLVFETKEQYVWDLKFDRDGVLYAATGPNGKIFQIRGVHNGEVYYDSDATNVMALDFDRHGHLLAATQGRGMVLRVTKVNEAYVLYTSSDDEVRAVTSNQLTGDLYAAVNGTRATSPLVESSSSKTPETGSSTSSTSSDRSSSSRTSTDRSSSSYVVQIQPSGFVTTFWSSPEGPIHALASDAGTTGALLVGAGKKGRLYRVMPTSSYSVLTDVPEPMILSLAFSPEGSMYLTTANKASLYKLLSSNRTGLFESRAFNAGSTVKWGNVAVDADVTSGTSIVVETRTGNTPDPTDRTWSPFTTATLVAEKYYQVKSPVAQYLQYRLSLSSGAEAAPAGNGPIVDTVRAYYVPHNAPPLIETIDIVKSEAAGSASSAALLAAMRRSSTATSSRPSSSSSAGEPEGDLSDPAGSRSSSSIRSSSSSSSPYGRDEGGEGTSVAFGEDLPHNSQRFRITWNVSDPNRDRMLSTVWLKSEDETVWRLVERELPVSSLPLSSASLADGLYRVRIESSDSPQNPPDSATTATLISETFTVDNTPPIIRELTGKAVGPGEWEVVARIEDATSVLAGADYSLSEWNEFTTIQPEDGVFDFPTETFRFRVRAGNPHPEQVLTLRTYDREGNVQIGKLILRTGGS